jgi:hypothetical protein
LAKPIKNSESKLVFNDEFDGQGPLDSQKWTISNPDSAEMTGNGTAVFNSGPFIWTNAENSYVWDYTKTYTVEISFRLSNEKIETAHYFGVVRKADENWPRPAFYFRPIDSNPALVFGSSVENVHHENTIKPPKESFTDMTKDFQNIKFVFNNDFHRAYSNDKFWCEFPVQANEDPAMQWRAMLAGYEKDSLEVDYVRIYQGDASSGSPHYEQRKLELAPGCQDVSFNAKAMFDAKEITDLVVDLFDGDILVDEIVIK